MKYTTGMASDGMINLTSFMVIGSVIKVMLRLLP
jgi:hypothetical protein